MARAMRWAIALAALCAPWFYGGGGVAAGMAFAALGLTGNETPCRPLIVLCFRR